MKSIASIPCLIVLSLFSVAILAPVTLQAQDGPARTSSSGGASAFHPVVEAWSSSAPSDNEDGETPQPAAAAVSLRAAALPVRHSSMRPFSAFAIATAAGSGGIGGDVATPLARGLELRVGGRVFDYRTTFQTDGIPANADITLQNVGLSVDIYPFRNSIHFSPGVSLHNDNHLFTTLQAATSQTFTLGNTDYRSSPTDPIRGTGRVTFGNRVAPRFTAGVGDMLERRGGHVSFPTELGFQYITPPTVQLTLTGTGCSTYGCGPINEGVSAQDIRAEEVKLENDLHPLRFYPIISVGVAYRLGRQRTPE